MIIIAIIVLVIKNKIKIRSVYAFNQRLPEQLMDEYPNLKFTFASVAKRVFVRNYWYENICHLYVHLHENQTIFMWKL